MGRGAAARKAGSVSLQVEIEHIAWHVAGRPVLSDVSFAIHGGEVAALMGRNGAGKSTLLDIVAGLRPPTSGEVRARLRSRRRSTRGKLPLRHLSPSCPCDHQQTA